MSETQDTTVSKAANEAFAQSELKSPLRAQGVDPPACIAQDGADDRTSGCASESVASERECSAAGERSCRLPVGEIAQEEETHLPQELEVLDRGKTSIIFCPQVIDSTSELDSLGAAIRNTREAVKAASPDDPARAALLHNLGVMLSRRFDVKATFEDLQEATQSFQDAVEATPANHPDRPKRLRDLGLQLIQRMKQTRPERKMLGKAICTLQEAVKAMLPSDPDRAALLNKLGLLLFVRGTTTQAPSDLVEAVWNLREAVEATPTKDHDRPRRLGDLGVTLEMLHRWTRELQHLKDAIRYCQEAAGIMPSHHPNREELFRKLDPMLVDRYKQTQVVEDLDMVIQNFRYQIEATPRNYSRHPEMLNELGFWLGERYKRTRDMKNLDEAIHNSQEAVNMSTSHHHRRAEILSNLVVQLSQRYFNTGQIRDVDDGIRIAQEAIEAVSSYNPGDLGARLYSNLGVMLRHRYHKTQALEDLDEAISKCQMGVEYTSPDDKDRANTLSDLGVMLGDRYNRKGSRYDLEDAIRWSREAVETKPHDQTVLAKCLNNLGIRLGEMYDKDSRPEDLEEAISNFREAIKATPSDHLDHAKWLNNLGMRLGDRYSRTRLTNDLEEAIHNIQGAVDATPPHNPDRAGVLNNLGNKLLSRYERTGLSRDLNSATASFERAAGTETGLPMERIKAARSLGNIFIKDLKWPEATKAFAFAFDVLQKLNPRLLPRVDQQWVLSELSGLSSDAASCALQADRPATEALELLEAGRCIIAGFAIDSRSDVEDLRAKDRNLCEEYEKYRLDEADLMQLAECGPMVTINVSRIRSDAIIVTSERIWARSLLDLSQDALGEKVEFFSAMGTRSHRNAVPRVKTDSKHPQKTQMKKNLLWLWDVVVSPVLSELAEQQFERIWWVAGGAIGRVPFHAAGDHSDGSLKNTISRVVSSYTSTFKALQYSRKKPKDKVSEGRMLLVDMPETPGHDKLDTQHEVTVLKDKFGDLLTLLTHPGKSVVLDKLKGCTFAHFACHGKSNPEDPSKAGLVLVEKGEQTLLTIQELDGVNLRSAEVAYLSACSTAELPAGKLMDEAIHLSNSFQLMGFRHVIGTMWGADDYAAGEVARMFYNALLSKSQGEYRGEFQVAQALHDALVEFRGRPDIRDDVVQWGPFIHVGV